MKKLREEAVKMFMVLMFTLLPLYYSDNYYNILNDKRDIYWLFSRILFVVIAVSLCISLMLVIKNHQFSKNKRTQLRKISALDVVMLLFGILAIVSTVYSADIRNSISGENAWDVGTQMIVKGHDFPKVTLVGALAADMSLYTDDYRSGERTFQLLTQAAGRAGRGDRPGEVVIQTYDPEHYAIEASAAQDYEAFYEKEIRYRSLMGYPPVENLMAVLAACEDEVLLEKACKYLKEYILRIKGQAQLDVIGPASPGVDKIKDIYRRVIYVKAPEYRTLVVLKDRMEQYIEINSGFQKMRIQFDFNPMNL